MKRCNAQSATEWAQSVSSRVKQSPSWFSKKPASVSIDFSVSSDACRLYDLLVLQNYQRGFRANLVEVTTRNLAALCKKSAATISRWLKQLERAGHIEKLSGRSSRSVYRLTSPAFTYKAIVQTAPNAVAQVESPQLPMLREKKRQCPKCFRRRPISSTSGVCEACLQEWAARTA